NLNRVHTGLPTRLGARPKDAMLICLRRSTTTADIRPMDFVGSRIGLNLGGRTYFSSFEDDFVSRLYRQSRQPEPGSHGSSNSP
ncbi:hypothetical protein RYX36_032355, partial [Vicia faba]